MDIERGVRSDPCNCPISLALKRAFPGAWSVSLLTQVAVFFMGGSLKARIPDSALLFMAAFDDNLPVSPIEFDLDFQ
jgi:hypothetical protein